MLERCKRSVSSTHSRFEYKQRAYNLRGSLLPLPHSARENFRKDHAENRIKQICVTLPQVVYAWLKSRLVAVGLSLCYFIFFIYHCMLYLKHLGIFFCHLTFKSERFRSGIQPLVKAFHWQTYRFVHVGHNFWCT